MNGFLYIINIIIIYNQIFERFVLNGRFVSNAVLMEHVNLKTFQGKLVLLFTKSEFYINRLCVRDNICCD